ncbi:hypothetical protein [Ascidiimonas sp. W6]|uniref:hypothetical protein n=1 Tax=Ascidiimonas meishanensis TaxID=3128903 RepID=UPI0030EEAC63
MSKKINLSFGAFELHEHHAVGIINEGVDLMSKENKDLINICQNYYASTPFGYISYRLNSYSVDPTVYIETGKLPNLVAIAVVISEPAQKLSATIEKIFFEKPFEYFNSLEEAQRWIHNIVVITNQQEKTR